MNYRKTSDFNPVKAKSLEELAAEINRTHQKITNELTAIERASTGSQNVTIINATSSSSGGGGSPSVGARFAADRVSNVPSTGQFIPFSPKLSAPPALLAIQCYVMEGTNMRGVGWTIPMNAVTESGFTIFPDETATVQYGAFPKS